MSYNLTPKAKRDYEYIQKALQNNDQQAYAYLMNKYKAAVFQQMLRKTKNDNDAEDLTTEAFVKAFSRLDQYSPEFAFSTWLFRIAANNAIDFIRRKQLGLDLEDTKPSDISSIGQVPDNEPGPEQQLIQEQQTKMLRQLVEKLMPNYRQLIELRYFEDLSYAEISERLGLPIGTVKIRLYRARGYLTRYLNRKQYKGQD